MKQLFCFAFLAFYALCCTSTLAQTEKREKTPVYHAYGREITPQAENFDCIHQLLQRIEQRDQVSESILPVTLRTSTGTIISEYSVASVPAERRICESSYNPDYKFYPSLQTRYNSSGRTPSWSFNQNQALWRLITPPAYLSPGKI